jgi:glucan phosphoethanolaminetransferase (alkaline phosphatase superfamily)
MVVGTTDIAITVFVLAISLGLYGFPMLLILAGKHLFQNPFWDVLAKRVFFILGTYSMIFNISIMYQIVDTAVLPVKQQLSLYIWLFGMLGWLLILYLVVRTLIDAVLFIRINQRMKRQELEL